MRLIIKMEADREIVLPKSYNHIVQAWLYNQISDLAYRLFLHNKGYRAETEKSSFKFFTFSRIFGKWRLHENKQHIVFSSPVNIHLASPLLYLMQDVATTSLLGQGSQLGDNMLKIVGIEAKNDDMKIEQSSYRITALSPIVVYKTLQNGDKKTTRYYHPREPEFNQLVKENLKHKSQVLLEHGFNEYGPLEGDFSIRPLFDPLKKNSTALYYKGFFIKGYVGDYEVTCERTWMKVALDTGLGGKNAQGFGMVEVKG